MEATYITAFITSIQNVFSTMLQLPVEVNEPRLKSDAEPTHDISGIIGMSGSVEGSVALSFPEDTAEALVTIFTGERLDVNTADFADAVGELINMISGGAKAGFGKKSVSISCPSVIVGKGHHVARQSDIPCVLIPCTTDCGEFVIEVSVRDAPGADAADAAAAGAAGA